MNVDVIRPVPLDYGAVPLKIKRTLTKETVDYRVELDVYNGPLD